GTTKYDDDHAFDRPSHSTTARVARRAGGVVPRRGFFGLHPRRPGGETALLQDHAVRVGAEQGAALGEGGRAFLQGRGGAHRGQGRGYRRRRGGRAHLSVGGFRRTG